MKVILNKDLTFHDCNCHCGGDGYRTFRAGTTAYAVDRHSVTGDEQRRDLVAMVERMKEDGGRPVVLRLGGAYRVVDRDSVYSEQEMARRRAETRGMR